MVTLQDPLPSFIVPELAGIECSPPRKFFASRDSGILKIELAVALPPHEAVRFKIPFRVTAEAWIDWQSAR